MSTPTSYIGGAIPLDDLPQPGVAISRSRWTDLIAKEADLARLNELINDPAALHAHCRRHLTQAQVAHLFGERMTEILNENNQLKSAIANGQENCDAVYDELKTELAQARAELAALREDKARLLTALEEINEGKGAFNRDRLQHASNVIENTLAIASAAIAAARKESK